ncbi:hypothetical protein [Nostoc sp. FACHB-892]
MTTTYHHSAAFNDLPALLKGSGVSVSNKLIVIHFSRLILL